MTKGLDKCTRDGLLDRLENLDRAACALDARKQEVLAALARSDSGPDQWVREEVATALRIAPCTAGQRLADAVDLVHRLPRALAALAAGEVTLMHARALVDAVDGLSDEITATVEARVLARCEGKTVSEFRQHCRRAASALDPASAEQRHTRSLTDRRVTVSPERDGMAELSAFLRADHAGAILHRLTACTDTIHDPTAEERTADQQRADVLVDLLLGADLPPEAQPIALHITATLATFTGGSDQPAELDGHGPIPASMARRIASDPNAVWRHVLVNEDGVLVARGAKTYRPSPGLRDTIIARDRTCRFPGCRRTAARADLDHVTPFPEGQTIEANLHCLCRRHHRLKHDAGWTVTRTNDGTTTWVSPTGRRYDKPPDEYPVEPAA